MRLRLAQLLACLWVMVASGPALAQRVEGRAPATVACLVDPREAVGEPSRPKRDVEEPVPAFACHAARREPAPRAPALRPTGSTRRWIEHCCLLW